MNSIVDEGQFETSRQLVLEWQNRAERSAAPAERLEKLTEGVISVYTLEEAQRLADENWFIAAAIERLEENPTRLE
jgi:hypothetical protein